LALSLLQGGSHVFIWFAIFVILYDISNVFLERNWRYLFHILIIITLTPLLSFARIYTTAQAYTDFHQPFQPGYNPVNFLTWTIIPPLWIVPLNIFFIKKVWFDVPAWDGAIFWGLLIILIPLMIIKYKNYRNTAPAVKSNQKSGLNYDSVLVSSSILFLLSFFTIFEFIIKTVNTVLNAPFIESAEKYPFRLAIPAFLGFSILIAHFSNNIWQTIDGWLKNKWGGRLISHYIATTSFAKIMMYFFVIFFIVTFFASAFGFIFAQSILSWLMNTIQNAHAGAGSQWLIKKIEQMQLSQNAVLTGYFQSLLALLVICIFSFIIFLILKAYLKYIFLFKKTPYILFEMILVLPLLFSSLMWLALALSNPHYIYQTQRVLPPRIKITPDLPNVETKADATPQKLTIYPVKNPAIREYILAGVPAADGKFLDVASKNASLSESDGSLSILPLDSSPIILEVKSANYMNALYLTLAAWLALICAFIVNSLFHRRSKHSP
jgi:hypothetical protein